MKKLFIGLFLGVTLTALTAAGVEYIASKKTAEVSQIQGVYVFTDSKPVKEYDYLGSVKVTFVMKGHYNEVRDIMIKKAKEKYPSAEAIIFTDQDKADVIKFK